MTVQLKCSRCGNEWSAHSLAVAQGCRRCDPFPAALLPAESTTAEAFATVREALGYSGDSNTAFFKEEAAREALYMLERRMQEMERRAKAADDRWIHPGTIDV